MKFLMYPCSGSVAAHRILKCTLPGKPFLAKDVGWHITVPYYACSIKHVRNKKTAKGLGSIRKFKSILFPSVDPSPWPFVFCFLQSFLNHFLIDLNRYGRSRFASLLESSG
jgi:hypothetical protein